MPLLLGENNCQYTPLNTAGTTTLNPGQSGAPGVGQQGGGPSSFGVLYGVATLAPGTGFGFTAYDLIPPTGIGTNTATVTNTLMNGTNSAGVVQSAGLAGMGVRYKGALIVVTSGTPGLLNALWD